jgi:hypothetical protein
MSVIAVTDILARPVDDVTQVEKEGGICGAFVNVEIQIHGASNVLPWASTGSVGV